MHSEASYLLRSCIERINTQLEYSNFSKGQASRRAFSFYNILSNRTEHLRVAKGDTVEPVQVAPQDSVYIAYQQEFVGVFVFTDTHFKAYWKNHNQPQDALFTTARVNELEPFLQTEGATIVASPNYLYRGFGEGQYNGIYRLHITTVDKLANSSWEPVFQKDGRTLCKAIDANIEDKKVILTVPTTPLEKKKYGFGVSYSLPNEKDANFVVFGGGFNFSCSNEERVNKFLYVIKNDSKEIWKLGKYNALLFGEPDSLKQKSVIHPFVYGLPLESGRFISVLSTNGYMEQLNNFKKLLVSKLSMGESFSMKKIGFVVQNRLQTDLKSPEDTVASKNSILAMMLNSYHRVNRYKSTAVLSDANDVPHLLTLESNSVEYDTVTVRPVLRQEMGEEEDEMTVKFGPRRTLSQQQVDAFRKR